MKALCRDLGEMDYTACWELQRSLFEELAAAKRGGSPRPENGDPGGPRSGEKPESNDPGGPRSGKTEGARKDERGPETGEVGTVLLVEHPPVYTLGKSGRAENLLVDRAALERLGAQFFHIDRGGDITFHGPGQLVCYPILDLERIGIGLREYIDRLEEAVIRTVARYGIEAGRIAGASGVWIGGPEEQKRPEKEAEEKRGSEGHAEEQKGSEAGGQRGPERSADKRENAEKRAAEASRIKRDAPRKICAIGVRSSRYVTMHGFALNVTTDLEWFSRINPCGFRDRGVTSIARETGRDVAMEEVKRLVLRELERQLGIEIKQG